MGKGFYQMCNMSTTSGNLLLGKIKKWKLMYMNEWLKGGHGL